MAEAMHQMASAAERNKKVLEIAKTIAAEAAGEGQTGMVAVANVINNRAVQWKKDPYSIVSAKNQFYGYTAKDRDKRFEEVKNIVVPLAEAIVDGRLSQDITGGALYFRQPKEPIYSWHGEETKKIGGHIFHKERKK